MNDVKRPSTGLLSCAVLHMEYVYALMNEGPYPPSYRSWLILTSILHGEPGQHKLELL